MDCILCDQSVFSRKTNLHLLLSFAFILLLTHDESSFSLTTVKVVNEFYS